MPGILLGCALTAVWIMERDILIADLEESGIMDASKFYSRRINAKEILIRQKGDEFIVPLAEGAAKLLGRDYEFRETTLRRKEIVRSENLKGEFQGEPEEFQPTELEDDAEARVDFWSIQGDFIYRHHKELRVQLYVPKEGTFLFHSNKYLYMCDKDYTH